MTVPLPHSSSVFTCLHPFEKWQGNSIYRTIEHIGTLPLHGELGKIYDLTCKLFVSQFDSFFHFGPVRFHSELISFSHRTVSNLASR